MPAEPTARQHRTPMAAAAALVAAAVLFGVPPPAGAGWAEDLRALEARVAWRPVGDAVGALWPCRTFEEQFGERRRGHGEGLRAVAARWALPTPGLAEAEALAWASARAATRRCFSPALMAAYLGGDAPCRQGAWAGYLAELRAWAEEAWGREAKR